MLIFWGLIFFSSLFACNNPMQSTSSMGNKSSSQQNLTKADSEAEGGINSLTKNSDPYNVESLDGSVDEKEDLKKKLAIAERSFASLFDFKILNTFLCLRLRLFREECLINNPIISSGKETTLQCYETDASPSVVTRKLRVELSSTVDLNTKLYFLANDSYKSNSFSAGTSSLIFQSLGGTSSLSPSFRELKSLLIKPENPSAALPSYSAISINIFVDDTPIVSGGVLPSASASGEGSEYRVNLKQILETSRGSFCSVSDSSVTTISQKAKEYSEANKPSFSPFSASESKLPLSEKVSLTESLIASSESELNVERTRYSDFLSELQTTDQAGCRLSQEISSLSIRLYGSIIPQEVIQYNSPSAMTFKTKSADCMNLSINLGTGMSWSIDQDSQAILGSAAPEFLPDITGVGLTFADIKKVSLKRPGICIENQQIAVSDTVLGFIKTGVDYNYNVFEQNIFNITGVTIKANDLIVYENNELSITFDRKHSDLSWEDPLFEQNQKWLEMLQNEECNLTQ